MTISISSDTQLNTITRTVSIKGIRPILFDRYPGDNDTKLSWQEKIYLEPGSNQLVFPVANINSFYTAHNTQSAPKRLRDKRKYKDICNAIQSFVIISSLSDGDYVPFTRNGTAIDVGEFGDSEDPQSGLRLKRDVGRLEKGVPNPVARPLLPLPWELSWKMTIIKNTAIKEAEIRNLTIEGGLAVGFGTYRGVFGKFVVTDWS